MISRGRNDRIKGIWLIKNLIEPGFVTVPDEKYVWDGMRHHITDLRFSPEMRDEREILDSLPSLVEEYIRFYDYMEDNEKLRVSETISAGTVLQAFRDGCLMIRGDEDEGITIYGEQAYLDTLPDYDWFLREFAYTMAAYSDEWNGRAEISVTVSVKETYKTEEIEESLSVTYGFDPELEELLSRTDLSEEELNLAANRLPESERPMPISAEVSETLSKLSEMMKDIDLNASAPLPEECYEIDFIDQEVCERPGYMMLVPDGFVLRENVDGHGFVMWRPNEENPEAYEASKIYVEEEAFTEVSGEDERKISERTEGKDMIFDAVIPLDKGTLTLRMFFIGAGSGREDAARESASAIMGAVSNKY